MTLQNDLDGIHEEVRHNIKIRMDVIRPDTEQAVALFEKWIANYDKTGNLITDSTRMKNVMNAIKEGLIDKTNYSAQIKNVMVHLDTNISFINCLMRVSTAYVKKTEDELTGIEKLVYSDKQYKQMEGVTLTISGISYRDKNASANTASEYLTELYSEYIKFLSSAHHEGFRKMFDEKYDYDHEYKTLMILIFILDYILATNSELLFYLNADEHIEPLVVTLNFDRKD